MGWATSEQRPDEDCPEMMRLRRNIDDDDDDQVRPLDPEHHTVSRPLDRKCEQNPMRLMGILVVCLMVVSVLFSVSVVLRDPPSDGVGAIEEAKFLQVNPRKGTSFLSFGRRVIRFCYMCVFDTVYVFYFSFFIVIIRVFRILLRVLNWVSVVEHFT